MIDLNAPIRTRDGREAKYLGELPDGRHVIAWQENWRNRHTPPWRCQDFDIDRVALEFENTPPAPPPLTGYLPVHNVCNFGGTPLSLETISTRKRDGEWGKVEHAIDLSTLTAANFVQVGR